MANEYVLIQDKQNSLGQIAVSNNVFNHIVTITMNESDSIFFEDGTGKKSLIVRNGGSQVTIDVKVRVQYGKDVERIVQNFQTKLKQNFEMMVDYTNVTINVNIVGFKFN